MTITTSRGQTFDVFWCWAPTADGSLMLSLQDERRLPEIAADFDGLASIRRTSEEEGDAVYQGYDDLRGISRGSSGDVIITLGKS